MLGGDRRGEASLAAARELLARAAGAREAVEEACLKEEADYLLADTSEPLDATLARFLAEQAWGY
jgi:hypothetical protein